MIICTVRKFNKQFDVLPVYGQLRGKQVKILRGPAAVSV